MSYWNIGGSFTVWPLTITADRYGGTYSGAGYHAWELYPWDVPREAFGDDGTCMDFWGFTAKGKGSEKAGRYVVGLGSTPDEAFRDLERQLKAVSSDDDTEAA